MLNIAPDTLMASYIALQMMDVSRFKDKFQLLSSKDKLHLINAANVDEQCLKREIGRMGMGESIANNVSLLGVVHTTLNLLGELVQIKALNKKGKSISVDGDPFDMMVKTAGVKGADAAALKEILQGMTKPTGADTKMIASLAVEAELELLRESKPNKKHAKKTSQIISLEEKRLDKKAKRKDS